MAGAGRRVTRADVARLAGTSTAVVSYVVNDGPRPVSAATRRRVLAAIEEVGYEPNTVARALASGVSGVYGLVVPSISNPFFAALAHELQEAVAAAGKVLLLADSSNDKAREQNVVRTLARRRADGVLFVGVDDTPDLDALAGTPVILLDRVAESTEHYSVAIDNEAAAHEATGHLLAHGHTDVALVAGPENLTVGRARRAGWARALAEAGVEARASWIHEAPFSARGGAEAGRRLLGLGRRPRAVFASSEQQTIGLLSAAAGAGLRVPEDLAVMSFDGTEASEFSVPRISGIVQDLGSIATAAVGALESLDSGAEPPPERHVMAGYELRIRDSCGVHESEPRVARPGAERAEEAR